MDASTAAGLFVVCGAVAAGIYVLWGPENLFKRKGQCVGLQNLGNTCFMNAVLQALASVGSVLEWLQSLHGGRLTAALQHTLQCLREDGTGVVSPAPVLQALAWHGWSLDLRQQDAHELYHVFLTTLAEEMCLSCSLLFPLSSAKVSQSTSWIASTAKGPIFSLPQSTSCPLQGLLASELVCFTCQHTNPVKYEVFDSLSLNLPLCQPQVSLHSCLLDFIKSEVVADVECTKCSQSAGIAVKRTFMKQFRIARAPPILCLHLKQTVWLPSGNLHKCSMPVTFPSCLDLSALSNTLGHTYELVAMIEHLGGPLSGHYITYRCLQGLQWVQISDSAVYNCSLREVLSGSPYMLFYSKVKCNSSV